MEVHNLGVLSVGGYTCYVNVILNCIQMSFIPVSYHLLIVPIIQIVYSSLIIKKSTHLFVEPIIILSKHPILGTNAKEYPR